MQERSEIRKFHLYGDDLQRQSPDLVHIERIATRASVHNWVIAPHRHPAIVQLLFMKDGAGSVIAEGDEIALQPPALVLVPCNCPHAFRFANNAHGWVLSIAEAFLEDARLKSPGPDMALRGNRVLTTTLHSNPAHAELLALLLQEIERRTGDADATLTDGLYASLALLLTLAEESTQTLADQPPPIQQGPRVAMIRRFFRLVEDHFRENWSVVDYADALGSSQATLTRVCGEATGKAPGQLISERRIREAKRALTLTNASVNQISSELGYNDPAYFARSFRQHVGMTARAFRLQTRNEEPIR